MINNNTLAILPLGDTYSIVYEDNVSKIVKTRPNNIINYNCKMHGSSLEGRLKGTENLTGYSYKAPVSINNDLLFFPTTSPRLKECSWINLYNIKTVNYDKFERTTQIVFNNNKYIDFRISKNILNNQILKASFLDAKLKRNKV